MEVSKRAGERERGREKQFSLNRMSSLEMKNFFPSQSKWNFSSRVAIRNFRVGRSKGGFVLSKHLRIWNCSSLQRAHTLPSPFAMTFCTIEFMKNSQIFHSSNFQFQNFFDWFFFCFISGKTICGRRILQMAQAAREIYFKLVSWQKQTSFSLPLNQSLWKIQ